MYIFQLQRMGIYWKYHIASQAGLVWLGGFGFSLAGQSFSLKTKKGEYIQFFDFYRCWVREKTIGGCRDGGCPIRVGVSVPLRQTGYTGEGVLAVLNLIVFYYTLQNL